MISLRTALLALPLLLLPRAAAALEPPEQAIQAVKSKYPACRGEASPEAVEQAAAAHQQALEAFDKLEFGRAADLWSQAYGHDCTRPRVFVNIGNAFERAGDKAAAIAAYELLLERAPEGQERIQEKARILRKQLEDDYAKARADEQDEQAKQPPGGATAPQPESQGAPLGPAPFIGLAVGGATMIAGGVLLGVGLSQASSAADLCADPEARTGCTQEAADDGESGETMSQIGQGLLYGGGGLAALSLILQLAVNGDDSPETTAQIVPGPRSADVGLGLALRF